MLKMSKKILYFTADWCQPCQTVKPIFYDLETKYPDISFSAIDVQLNPNLAEKFNIKALPTFIFMVGDETKFFFSKADGKRLIECTEQLHAL